MFKPLKKSAICEKNLRIVARQRRFLRSRLSLTPRFSGVSEGCDLGRNRFSGFSQFLHHHVPMLKTVETVLRSDASGTPLKRGVNENSSCQGKFFVARAFSAKLVLSPCGAGDSLLKKLIIAAINADSGNVIVLSPGCPSFGSSKKARLTAGGFGQRRGSARRRAGAGQDAFLFFTTAAGRRLNLSRNGSRDFSLRRNFSEEKIPAPNKQPKINTTSNRKDASSAYPK